MATVQKKENVAFNEKERLHYSELLIQTMYYDRGDYTWLEETKIKLSGKALPSTRQKKYLKDASKAPSNHYNTPALKQWEVNRVGKLLTEKIGDKERLILFRDNLERRLEPDASEWDYFWKKSDELLKKDRERLGIKDHSARPSP